MDASTAKRRKLSHASGGLALSAGVTSTSTASAFVEATQDLLHDVQLDYGQVFDGVDQTLRQFKDAIEALEPHEPAPVSSLICDHGYLTDSSQIGDVTASFEKKEKITIPYPIRPPKDSPYKLSFAKPANVNVVGSYQLKTMVKTQSDVAVDMIVVMPRDCFQEKDFRDGRYFMKRSYYLATIAAGLRGAFSSSFDFSFRCLHGNELLPVLEARSKGTKSDKSDKSDKKTYAIRVIPCAPEDLFPASKLSPASNTTKDSTAPTPYYNSTLRAESLYSSYLKLLNSTAKSCGGFKDACILGRIWLQQRGLGEAGFSHFEWAVLVALLLQGGGRKGDAILSSSMNATQIFKATIQYLALTNFQKKTVVIGSKASVEGLKQGGPVLYDAAREHNILFRVSAWSSGFLQQHAKWALASLKNDTLDQFDSLFIIKVDQMLQEFDLVVKAKTPSETSLPTTFPGQAVSRAFSEKLHRTIKKALGDRAQLVHLVMPKRSAWPVSAKRSGTGDDSVLVGIILDSTHAPRRMDLGPSVEEKADAAKYRDFWGEKAELRRFQDGNILESVQWDETSPMSIPEQIVRYSAKLHLSLQGDDLEFHGGGSFSSVARISASDSQYYTAARQGFEALEKEIREIEDLPLHVRQVAPVSPELRYASLRPPKPASRLPMDAIISFEASGKWTDNLAANQRLKIAFLLKLGSSLSEANPEITTHLGVDQVEHEIRNLAFLDVSYEGGFTFRLRVQSDVEEKALENQLKNKQLDRNVHAEAAESLAICRRLFTNLPLHNQTVSTWCTRFPPLSDSMRLLKYWFSCHKLACHFSEELLELFVLRAFLTPYPWQTPTSAMTGFLRAMQALARWDWTDEPLVIDHAESLTSSDRSAIMARYQEVRRQDPRMNRVVLFVATSHDTSGTSYTLNGPSRVVANQMTKLARSACELVKSKGIDLDPRSLFQSSSKHFDVVIRLDPKVLKSILRDDGTKHSHFRNLEERSAKLALPLVNHPAKALLDELNTMYANALVFFHGAEDDGVIAGLFNPELGRRTRKVDMPCAYKPGSEEGSLDVDRRSMIAEIARIGGDLVEKIEVREGI